MLKCLHKKSVRVGTFILSFAVVSAAIVEVFDVFIFSSPAVNLCSLMLFFLLLLHLCYFMI